MIKVSLRGVGHSKELSAGRRSNLAVKDEIATLPPFFGIDICKNTKCAFFSRSSPFPDRILP